MWSSADFTQMGWHDSQLHGMAFVATDDLEPEHSLLLDLDYIVRWVDGPKPDSHYTFWVAPVTLAFDNAWDVRLSGVIDQLDMAEVLDLHLVRSFENAAGVHFDEWHLEGDGFDLRVLSSDFKQYVRRPPIHTNAQSLGTSERGGPSFDRVGFDGCA